MKISTRETVLGWLTTVAVLFGVTYWLGEPKYREFKEAGKTEAALVDRMNLAKRLLEQRGDVNKKLEEFRKQVPQHPAGQDVTAELLKSLERAAQEHGVVLLRREPDKEKSVGDLYEIAINCSWEAELDGLVHFLYALQVQGAIFDVRQLTVTPGQGGPGRLKGNFTVDCAYTRTSTGLQSLKVEATDK